MEASLAPDRCVPQGLYGPEIARFSVQRVGNRKRKRIDNRVELGAIVPHHLKGALHSSHRCAQRTGTRVLKVLAGLQAGLIAHDARPFYHLNNALTVGDHPPTRDELRGLLAFVGNDDGVRKKVVAAVVVRALLNKAGRRDDTDPLGDGIGQLNLPFRYFYPKGTR